MGLALLAFSEPDNGADSTRALLRQIKLDRRDLDEFRKAFDPRPSDSIFRVTTKKFGDAEHQLGALFDKTRELSMRYHRYLDDDHERILTHPDLQIPWERLCLRINLSLEYLDEADIDSYKRVRVWRKLDDVDIAYGKFEQALKSFGDQERKASR